MEIQRDTQIIHIPVNLAGRAESSPHPIRTVPVSPLAYPSLFCGRSEALSNAPVREGRRTCCNSLYQTYATYRGHAITFAKLLQAVRGPVSTVWHRRGHPADPSRERYIGWLKSMNSTVDFKKWISVTRGSKKIWRLKSYGICCLTVLWTVTGISEKITV